jgi:hypothetical protein
MGSSLLIAIVVFAASLFLLFSQPKDAIRVVVFVAAALELLLALGILHLSVRGLPTAQVLAAIFAVLGAILYFRSSAKFQVTAATCVTLVGALGLLSSLHLVR